MTTDPYATTHLPAPARRWTESATVKLIVLGFLILLLLIPVASVIGLVRERQQRQVGVREEVASIWGRRQTLTGPVLQLPFTLVRATAKGGRLATDGTLVVLPEELRWEGEIRPERRHRGIFEVTVYQASLRGSGSFRLPDSAETGATADQTVIWRRPRVSLGLPDARGLEQQVALVWNGARLDVLPGLAGDFAAGGLHALLPEIRDGAGTAIPFTLALDLRGSETLRFAPAGKETVVELRSSWPDPSFSGAYLPRRHNVTASGFSALWSVPFYGRGLPQIWLAGQVDAAPLEAAAFGVDLVQPADGYQRTERAVKYAVLFILLTFVTVFLLEVLGTARLHPVQYLLVGFALCLFYVLLLALGERLGFGLAYAIAAGAIALLITSYVRAILGGRRAGILLALLTALYAYLYFLLQAEDNALLLGAVGLFVILALVMLLTRRLDWYRLEFRRAVVD